MKEITEEEALKRLQEIEQGQHVNKRGPKKLPAYRKKILMPLMLEKYIVDALGRKELKQILERYAKQRFDKEYKKIPNIDSQQNSSNH